MDENRKTTQEHWDNAWDSSIRFRVPSRLNVGVLNITSLLAKHVKPNDKYIEIGCAPGKLLSWVANKLGAKVSGIDYSNVGVNQTKALMNELNIKAEIFEDDFFNNKLEKNSYDVVTSFGFIEHFDDIFPAVNKHVELLSSGGTALILIPNYSGIYGKLQNWCDPENLELHNTKIMNPKTLINSVTMDDSIEEVNSYYYGKVDPWIVNIDKKIPKVISKLLNYFVNTVGLLQPFTCRAIAPLIVLEVKKK